MNALAACHRARRAWELSQPQTFMDFDELDGQSGVREVDPKAHGAATLSPSPVLVSGLSVEPVTAAHSPEVRGGLDSRLRAGDGFLRDPGEGASLRRPSPALSRVLNPGAEPCRVQRELTAGTALTVGPDSSSAALAASSAGSAPLSRRVAVDRRGGNAPVRSDAPDDLNTTGPDAIPPKENASGPTGGEV